MLVPYGAREGVVAQHYRLRDAREFAQFPLGRPVPTRITSILEKLKLKKAPQGASPDFITTPRPIPQTPLAYDKAIPGSGAHTWDDFGAKLGTPMRRRGLRLKSQLLFRGTKLSGRAALRFKPSPQSLQWGGGYASGNIRHATANLRDAQAYGRGSNGIRVINA